MISREVLIEAIKNIGNTIEENRGFLTDLDIAIGDGDHGINMSKGFKAVAEKLPTFHDQECGAILKTVAMTLISTVGGASGPLYGTAFLKAANVVKGKTELDHNDVVTMIKAGIDGIVLRGHANKGDKTMLDALYPAYEALKASLEKQEPLTEAFEKAMNAAYEGVEYTKTIKAIKGRASYLGERSIGHQDPGATSSYLMIKAVYHTIMK